MTDPNTETRFNKTLLAGFKILRFKGYNFIFVN